MLPQAHRQRVCCTASPGSAYSAHARVRGNPQTSTLCTPPRTRGDTTTRALSACLPRASTGPASPGRSNARRRSCSGCYLPHAREVVSQCSGCSVWRNVWRSPPVHDVGRRSIVLADSCATLAPRAVTLVQLARCASASAHDLHTRRDTSPKCGMC